MNTKEFILGVADGELSKKDILDYAKEYFATCSELDSLLIKMTAQTMNEPEIVFIGDRGKDGMEKIKEISRVSIEQQKQNDRLFKAMGIIEAYKDRLGQPQQVQTPTLLPVELQTDEAIRYINKAKELGLISDNGQWQKGLQMLACFARDMSIRLHLGKGERIAWQPFEKYFGIEKNKLRLNYNDIQKTGQMPTEVYLIDKVFE